MNTAIDETATFVNYIKLALNTSNTLRFRCRKVTHYFCLANNLGMKNWESSRNNASVTTLYATHLVQFCSIIPVSKISAIHFLRRIAIVLRYHVVCLASLSNITQAFV
jgi:hypothetical protein